MSKKKLDRRNVVTFNVLCVSKHTADEQKHLWHQAISGPAAVFTTQEEHAGGVIIAETWVEFGDDTYRVTGSGTGLSGSVLVLVVHNAKDYPYVMWEFYTDIPALHGVSTQELQELAELAVKGK